MKILVTGGAGYCGSFATRDLLAAGHQVVVFDSLYQGHRAAVPADVAFVEGDLRDADAVARLFAEHTGFDGIMHFASFTLAGESMQQPLKYLRDNLLAGANLLEQAVAHDVGRFILSSTANLFDDPAKLPIEPDERIVPGSPYGELKFFLERLLHWFERIYGLKLRLPALLQRCRRHARSRRASRSGAALHPGGAPGGARPARKCDDLWRRLPNQRWHLRARLYPCRRSGPGTHPGARIA